MKNCFLLATVLSAQAIVGKQQTQATKHFPLHSTTEISPEDAKGGIQKLVDRGFLHPKAQQKDRDTRRRLPKKEGGTTETKSGGSPGHSQSAGVRTGTVRTGSGQQQHKQQQPKRSKPPTSRTQPGEAEDTKRWHDPIYTDDWNDEYFEYDDVYVVGDDYYGGKGKGGPIYYDDDYYYPSDDTYRSGKGKGKGGGSRKSSKSSKKGSGGKGKGKGGYYDDDYYHGDDYYIVDDDAILSDDLYTGEACYLLEAFFDTRFMQAPVPVQPSAPDLYAPGTVNLYVDAPLWEIWGVDTSSMVGIVQGTCTRTDPDYVGAPATPPAGYTGSGVCDFTFEAFDGNAVVASFTATGTVSNDYVYGSVLTVTGGLGEFAGVSGSVVLVPASLETNATGTGAFVSWPANRDFLSYPGDGYYMTAELYADTRIGFLEGVDDDEYWLTTDDKWLEGLDDDFWLDGGLELPDTSDPSSESPTVSAGTAGPGTAGPSTIVPGTADPSAQTPLSGGIVNCPGLAPEDFCDCGVDCYEFTDGYANCECEEAQGPSCCSNTA